MVMFLPNDVAFIFEFGNFISNAKEDSGLQADFRPEMNFAAPKGANRAKI
jgi:hypothetical protein